MYGIQDEAWLVMKKRKGKEKEVTEQEKITDTIRGHEVNNKDRTKSTVG